MDGVSILFLKKGFNIFQSMSQGCGGLGEKHIMALERERVSHFPR